MIDAHIHADTRPYEDFERMALTGITAAITCAHDPLRMSTAEVVLDHIDRIMTNDVERTAKNGLKLYSAIGIHPRSISPDFGGVLEKLPELLKQENVVAIGEIGLEKASELEKDVFIRQLQLAQELPMKVIVHTPRTNKREITKVTLSVIEENIDTSLVQIDHIDPSIIDLVTDFDGLLGLTVQPQKVTPDEAVIMLEEYGVGKFALDSDMSSSPSDPLSVPKTVHRMRLAGFSEADIKKVSSGNVAEFYGI